MNASVKMDPAATMQWMRDSVTGASNRARKDLPALIKSYPVAFGIGTAAFLSLVFVLVLWGSSDRGGAAWRPLYGRQELYDVPAVLETLDAGRIDYSVHPDSGQVLINTEQLASARMQLATAGIQPESAEGMELLMNGGQLGRSQFVERKQYLKGLEGELERTIVSLRPVRSARVHLAVPERTAFLRDQVEPSASVYLDLQPGINLDGAQVQGIINLLSGSFPDLKPERVSVLDQNSNPLTPGKETVRESDLQLEYQQTVERQYARRLINLLEPLVGEDNLRVAVNADIDFSYQESSREGFDPDSAVVRSESFSGNGGPDLAQGVPGAASNVENLAEDDVEAEPAESSISSVRNYEVNKTVSYQRLDSFRIARVNASVILNSRVLGAEAADADAAMSAVDDLVSNAIGIDLNRGDRISVRTLPFYDDSATEGASGSSVARVAREGGSMMPVLMMLLAVLLVLTVGGSVYAYRKRKQRREQEALAAELALLDASAGNEDQEEDMFNRGEASASDRVRDLAVSSPDQIATILERWIKEGD